MKYYLIAGEASGDLHGANLLKAIKQADAQWDFKYFGGDKMKAEGGVLVKHYADMAFMGLKEVILNIRTFLKNMAICKAAILAYHPDALILIDFPGFNLKIARFAKQNNIKVYYYISPKVWAWNQKRVLNIKKAVDKMFCILPFEVDFYKKWGMEVEYVGNPLLDEISLFKPNQNFKKENDLNDKPIIALLPGSRTQEIKNILPEMLSVIENFPDYRFVVAAAPNFTPTYYQKIIADQNVRLVYNQTYDLLHVAQAAVVASGTAALETALFKVPQVVVYKGAAINIAIAKLLIKTRFISLVNLIMDREVVTELIQKDCNQSEIINALNLLLFGKKRAEMLKDYQVLLQKIGQAGASQRVANAVVASLL